MDDRITCPQCRNLRPDGRCQAAVIRTLAYTSANYKPLLDVRHRCVCFEALPTEADRRSARERWPSLFEVAA